MTTPVFEYISGCRYHAETIVPSADLISPDSVHRYVVKDLMYAIADELRDKVAVVRTDVGGETRFTTSLYVFTEAELRTLYRLILESRP